MGCCRPCCCTYYSDCAKNGNHLRIVLLLLAVTEEWIKDMPYRQRSQPTLIKENKKKNGKPPPSWRCWRRRWWKSSFTGFAFGFYGERAVALAPGQPPVTPNTSNVASGTLLIPFRAAILSSAPYINNIGTLIVRNHINRVWVARRLPIAAIIRSK